MNFKWAFFVPLFWLASSSNSCRSYPHNIVRIQLILPDMDVVPVLSIAFLKLFMSARNSSGLPFLNVEIFSLYISDADNFGFQRILILMMSLAFSSSSSTLISGIGGGSISACTSALIQLVLMWILIIIYLWVLGSCSFFTRSDFAKWCTC